MLGWPECGLIGEAGVGGDAAPVPAHGRRVSAVLFLYILLGTVMALAGVLTAGALFYMYWIEIVLLYRTYQNKDETLGGKMTQLASELT